MDVTVLTKNNQSFTLQILPLRAYPKYIFVKIKNDKLGTETCRYFKRISDNNTDSSYEEIEIVEATKKE